MNKLKKIWNKLLPETFFFITPEVIKGVGLEDKLSNYHIICSRNSPLIEILRKRGTNIFCLEEHIGIKAKDINNSAKLLSQSQVLDYIKYNAKTAYIMYFKPSLKIEMLCQKYGFNPVGNSQSLNLEFEDKINIFKLSKKYFSKYHIPGSIDVLARVKFNHITDKIGMPFVIQFARSWSGKHTYFIDNKTQFNNLVKKFPHSRVRISKKILGPTLLNNCCVTNNGPVIGATAIQLSGINKLYPNEAVTCGRQWPAENISLRQFKTIYHISQKMGEIMRKRGYRGFYGLDFMLEEKSGNIFLAENNARLTASTSFYTKLELASGIIPLLFYHIASFLQKEITFKDIYQGEISGSQIIFRCRKYLPKFVENFGIYKLTGNRFYFVKKDYCPEELSKNEFIYIKSDTSNNGISERARIETKKKVLESPRRLQKWIENILQTKG